MSDNQSANFPPLVSREQNDNAICKALRLFVGRRRQYSVKQLSNGTGVKDRMIECAMTDPENIDHRALPSWALLSVMTFLGPVFSNEILAQTGQGAFDLPDVEPRPGDLAADNTDDNATVVRAAIDGEFCEKETPDLKTVGTRMMSRGATLVALGSKAA